MAAQIRVLHYLNQFFGGVGSEEKANIPPEIREEPIGPGRLLASALEKSGGGSVVATIVCGDNYIVEETGSAIAAVNEAIDRYKPDVVVAGPAFDAGRYGLGCAYVCMAARDRGVPAVSAMDPENTGVLTYRKEFLALPTGADASAMSEAVGRLAAFARRLADGDELGPALEEGYIPRGYRREIIHDKNGAERAFDMMLARMSGDPYVSEVQTQQYEAVSPAPAVGDLSTTTIALITSGGLVPKGNPDRQVGGRATDFFSYNIEGLTELSPDEWESVHMGFSTQHLNTRDPSYVLPLPIVRELESAGVIGGVYGKFFSTTGNGTPVTTARRMATDIARELKEEGVGAALLVAT